MTYQLDPKHHKQSQHSFNTVQIAFATRDQTYEYFVGSIAEGDVIVEGEPSLSPIVALSDEVVC